MLKKVPVLSSVGTVPRESKNGKTPSIAPNAVQENQSLPDHVRSACLDVLGRNLVKRITSKGIDIRPWNDADDISRITEILHRSYAQLADLGFRYHATWQGDDTTLKRLKKGLSYLAIDNGLIVGTITLSVPPNVSGCSWYNRGDVASFGQFGVDPDFQRNGIGSRLLDTVEIEAKKQRVPNLALDTAEGASHLIEIYNKRGYEFVGYADWEITNYRSVILNKALSEHG